MKKVESYKAEDGRLFEDKEECLKHDFLLSVRGFIQTKNSSKSPTIQVSDVAALIANNFPTFYDMMKRQNQLLVAARPKKEMPMRVV